MFENILVETREETLIIKINRPKALNALSSKVFNELEEVIKTLYTDSSLRGAIVTGEGPKAFIAGADIKEVNQLSEDESLAYSKRGQNLFSKMEACPKPIIAAVNGFALGGGCELAMACHLRTAIPEAKFGQPEVNLGLIAGYGGTQRLPRLIGLGKATELLLTGNMITGVEAQSLGLVNQLFEKEDLIEQTLKLLQKIYSKGPLAIKLTLEAIYAGVYKPETGMGEEARKFSQAVNSQDGKEGTLAFTEKRKANFNPL